MKTVKWEHSYLVTMMDEIEIPDDFEISEFWTRWGILTIVSTDGEELVFHSDLDADTEYKHPESLQLYDEDWNEIGSTT